MRLAIAIAVLLSFDMHAAICDPLFDSPPSVTLPREAADVAVGDVTGDGRPDLVVSGYDIGFIPALSLRATYGALSIFQSSSDRILYTTLDAPDLDGDGDADVVTYEHARFVPGASGVLAFNNMAGAFARGAWGPAEAIAPWPNKVLTGDFNGDHHRDLAFAATGANRVLLMLGAANGTFAQSWLDTGSEKLTGDAAFGDIDGDGRDDLVFAREQSIVVLHGTSGLIFPAEYAMGGVVNVAIADVDGDGRRDVVCQPVTGNGFGWISGSGPAAVAIPLSYYYAFFVFADFTGDGRMDVGALLNPPSLFRVYEQRNGAYVRGADYLVNMRQFYGADATRVADVDRDGDLDVVVLAQRDVTILVNDGHARFRSPAAIVETSNGAADFNNDGRDDLLSGADAWLSQPDGTFRRASSSSFSTTSRAHIVDLDGDGNLDWLYVTNSNNVMLLASGLGRGDGTFTVRIDQYAGRTLTAPALVADLDLDGRLDVLAASSQGNVVAYGNGDGTFDPLQPLPGLFSPPGRFSAVADFNNDGHPDLYLDGIHLNLVHSYAPRIVTLPGFAPRAFADVNEDGYPDAIASGGIVPASISIALGHGDGTFAAPLQYALPNPAGGPLLVRDFNADGHLDILAASEEIRGPAAIAFNDGTGAFASSSTTFLNTTFALYAGDFDADGRADLLDGSFARRNVCGDDASRRRTSRH